MDSSLVGPQDGEQIQAGAEEGIEAVGFDSTPAQPQSERENEADREEELVGDRNAESLGNVGGAPAAADPLSSPASGSGHVFDPMGDIAARVRP